MDYDLNRQKYLWIYSDILGKIKLNDRLINSIKGHTSVLWKMNKNPKPEAIKSYILLELTRNRSSCRKIIEYLKGSGEPENMDLAKSIQELNEPIPRIEYGEEVNIPVTQVRWPNIKDELTSRNYSMSKNPRGKAFIINLIPDLVKKEHKRFESVFSQLLFKVIMPEWKTTSEIISGLKKECELIEDDSDEAVIVMIITHGKNDMISGGNDPKDKVAISEIVNVFADLEIDITKMFYFNCCRNITPGIVPSTRKWATGAQINTLDNKESAAQKSPIVVSATKEEKTTFKDAYVFYYTAQEILFTGHSAYAGSGDYTPYGKLLSESFAQYAHDTDLEEIITKTNQAYKHLLKSTKDLPDCIRGRFFPESTRKGNQKALYFNPGWFKTESDE